MVVLGGGQGVLWAMHPSKDRNQVERVAMKDPVREKRGRGGGIRKEGSDMER